MVSALHFLGSIFFYDISLFHMDSFGWLGLVVLCSWWFRASSADGMGRKFMSELNEASPILMEMGCWDIVLRV